MSSASERLGQASTGLAATSSVAATVGTASAAAVAAGTAGALGTAAAASGFFPPASIILGMLALTAGLVGKGMGNEEAREGAVAGAKEKRAQVVKAREDSASAFDEQLGKEEFAYKEKEQAVSDSMTKATAGRTELQAKHKDIEKQAMDGLNSPIEASKRKAQMFEAGAGIDKFDAIYTDEKRGQYGL